MAISSLSLAEFFIGALGTKKLFYVQRKRRTKENAIAAKVVEHWLNAPENRLTILNRWCRLVRNGAEIGTTIGIGSLLGVTNSKSCVNRAIATKQLRKTKGGKDNGDVLGSRNRA